MITPRSVLKFDLFAEAPRKRKIDEVGDRPTAGDSQRIDFDESSKRGTPTLRPPCAPAYVGRWAQERQDAFPGVCEEDRRSRPGPRAGQDGSGAWKRKSHP